MRRQLQCPPVRLLSIFPQSMPQQSVGIVPPQSHILWRLANSFFQILNHFVFVIHITDSPIEDCFYKRRFL